MLIIPGRPKADSLAWWALYPTANVPNFVLDGPGPTKQFTVFPIKADSDKLPGYSVDLVCAVGLDADSKYTLVDSFTETAVTSQTYPTELSTSDPFTIAFGPCYCLARDQGLSACYPPPLHSSDLDPIRVRFLCGDQIYMDLSPDSGGPITFSSPDPWQRYVGQWRTPRFAEFLVKSPNLMMADDHEFWNDYPHDNIWLFWTSPVERKILDRLFSIFQAALNIDVTTVAQNGQNIGSLISDEARAFSFDLDPLSFFVLDTRTKRTRYDAKAQRLTLPTWLNRARTWLAGLTGPGVLFLSQPLIEQPASLLQRLSHTMGDVNLPDYYEDYAALWDAVLGAPHDVIIASGDIHWSRCYLICRAGESRPRAYELISSAFACIPGSPHDVDAEPSMGKVKWQSGAATWVATAGPTNRSPMYATVSFKKFGVQVKVEARWWSLDPRNANGAIQIRSCDLCLN